jgi:3-hydroxyacyl-CoA dehydrogenase
VNPDRLVTTTVSDGIATIAIENPPVNALSNGVRQGIQRALSAAQARPEVQAIVLHGNGRSFSAGADIREFGKVREQPWTAALASSAEKGGKPVVAAIHGATLGGGLELALGAHLRVAAKSATLGLPEVKLGLIPGGGGTQRLPRLVGAAVAADMVSTGATVSATRALDIGLVDAVADDDQVLDVAIARAKDLASGKLPLRRTQDAGALRDKAASLQALESVRAASAQRTRGQLAPALALDAVGKAIEGDFEAGMQFEAEAFQKCMASPQRAGLIHAFFAERTAGHRPVGPGATPRKLVSVGVIGGGTMGSGICVALLDADLAVVMLERDETSLEAGLGRVKKVYSRLVETGRATQEAAANALSRIRGTLAYADFSDVDMVIEAAFEDLEVKRGIFKTLDTVCKNGAVLATNTSYLDVDRIAGAISRPQDVIGLHFFSPANVMKLLEVVVPAQVADDVVATGFELARRLKKIPVRSGVCDGFIGNRILFTYREAASYMLEDGASPYDIDQALEAFGFAMGPFRTNDLTGGDIGWATRRRKDATRNPAARYVRIADALYTRGWLGQKTGRGYYRYPEGARKGLQDDEVLALIAQERQSRGVTARPISHAEIVERYMAALINEASKVLEDGIALRPSDIDVVMVNGYGFPRWRGGPMKYADALGLQGVVDTLERLAKEDALFWTPSQLLTRLAAEGKTFSSLNADK